MGSVFEAKNHFVYLADKLSSKDAPRGIKTKFSEHLMIQPAFLSQVLSEKYCLNLEQADLASQFFEHTNEEAEFFLLLVSRDRAGTASLKKHFENQVQNIIKKRLLVVERLGRKSEMSDEAKGVYYSSWIYPAVHILTTIPGYRTRKALAEKTDMPAEVIAKVLEFLSENHLIKKESDEFLPTQSWVRVDKESPHVVKHHANWRQKAIQNLEKQTEFDLHYSGVFSMDTKTAGKLKDHLLDFLKKEMKAIETAKEEDLYVVVMDLFNLK